MRNLVSIKGSTNPVAVEAFEKVVAPEVARVVDLACGEADTAWLILMHGVVLTIRSVNTWFNKDGSVKTVQLTCEPVPVKL